MRYNMATKASYLFDICGTLYHSNTTYDFLLWYHRKYHPRKYLFCKGILSLPSKAVLVLFSKLGISWDVRGWLIGTLGKEDKNLVYQETMIFVAEFLENKRNERVHDLLNHAKSQKSEVILVSASIYPVVSSISHSLGVRHFFATQLAEDQKGRFSGKITKDLKGEKLKILKASGFDFGRETVIITDNLDDVDLIKMCSNAVVVSKKQNISYWTNRLIHHPHYEIIHV